MRPRFVVLPTVSFLLAALLACASPGGAEEPRDETAPLAERVAAGLRVSVVTTGLDHPWEVKQLPTGQLLVTQRERRLLTLVDASSGAKRNLAFPSERIFSSGETGLLGLEVDPAFSKNRRIYTCSGWNSTGGKRDIRVIAWTLDAGLTKASYSRALVIGLPLTSGRHGGCRLLIARSGALLVGTGDAAVGTNPQNVNSLGGKVLRLDRFNGKPHRANRWFTGKGNRRLVMSYGHRNVQGLAQRADGSIWEVEHGSNRDDEVNLIASGRNYGWNPVPGYNERVPMTDQSLPGPQDNARWRSGDPTIAPSGADFVTGAAWGSFRDTLAVAVLKDRHLMFLKFDAKGRLVSSRAPAEMREYGRLRDVTTTKANTLLVTTDNGNGEDAILLVRPPA